MDNQVLDEGTCPALGDTDNALPFIDREETKVNGKFFVISNAGPPLFERSNVPTPLGVTNLKKTVNLRCVVRCKRPHVVAGRPTRLGDHRS